MKKVLSKIITKKKFGLTCRKSEVAMAMGNDVKKKPVEHQNFRKR